MLALVNVAILLLIGTGILLAQDRSAAPAIFLVPSPPTNLYASGITETSALLNWNYAEYAVSYEVHVNSKLISTTKNIQYRITNLDPNTVYTFQIYSVNTNGTTQSFTQTFRTKSKNEIDSSRIETPLNFHVVDLKPTSFRVEWEPSKNTEYTAYATETQLNNVTIQASSITSSSATFRNVKSGIAYTVHVNSKGKYTSTSPSLLVITPQGLSVSNTQSNANTFLCQDSNVPKRLYRTSDFQTYQLVTSDAPVSKFLKYVQKGICLGQSGKTLYRSTNSGTTWTTMNLTTTNDFVDALFVAGKYVVADYNNLYESIDDGSSWKILFNAKPFVQITKLYQNNSLLVVSGSYTNLWAATNLSSFASAVPGIDIPSNTFYGYDMILAENQLIGLITDLTNTYRILGTTPGYGGLNVSAVNVANPFFVPMGLVYDGETLVCAVFTDGTGSAIQYSTDLGLSWTAATGSVVNKSASDPVKYPPLFGVTTNTIHYNGSTFAFLASDNTVHISNDGKTWTQLNIFPGGATFEAICYEAPDFTNSRR